MRVDLSQLTANQVASEHGAKKIERQDLGGSEASGSGDRTSFSTDSSSVSSLANQAMSTPEVRQELVSQLKEAVNSGQYKIDPQAIASSMVNERA